jgi:hypothetical protein
LSEKKLHFAQNCIRFWGTSRSAISHLLLGSRSFSFSFSLRFVLQKEPDIGGRRSPLLKIIVRP